MRPVVYRIEEAVYSFLIRYLDRVQATTAHSPGTGGRDANSDTDPGTVTGYA